jgi:hypothetical protein
VTCVFVETLDPDGKRWEAALAFLLAVGQANA